MDIKTNDVDPPAGPPGTAVGDIPRAFLEISTFREQVGMKRVEVGDKRRHLHTVLDDLIVELKSLESVFEQLSSQLGSDDYHDLCSRVETFGESLQKFISVDAEYYQLDDELGGEEYRLSQYEHRVYDQLCRRNGPSVPSAFSDSLSLASDTISKPSRPVSLGNYSFAGSDSYEVNFGRGTPVGSLPFPDLNVIGPIYDTSLPMEGSQASRNLPLVPDGLAHFDPVTKDIGDVSADSPAGLVPGTLYSEQGNPAGNIGSADATACPFSLGTILKTAFPPLFLAGTGDGILQYLVTQFQSTQERVDRWLLHMLRSSEWEIRRFYLNFQAVVKSKGAEIHPDMHSWSIWVIRVWSQDSQLDSHSSHRPPPLTSSFSGNPLVQARKQVKFDQATILTGHRTDPLFRKAPKGKITQPSDPFPFSPFLDFNRSDGYFGDHPTMGSLPDVLAEKSKFPYEEYAHLLKKGQRNGSYCSSLDLPNPLPDPTEADRRSGPTDCTSELLREAGAFLSQLSLEPSEFPQGFMADDDEHAFFADSNRSSCELLTPISPVEQNISGEAKRSTDSLVIDFESKDQLDPTETLSAEDTERPPSCSILQEATETEKAEQTEKAKLTESSTAKAEETGPAGLSIQNWVRRQSQDTLLMPLFPPDLNRGIRIPTVSSPNSRKQGNCLKRSNSDAFTRPCMRTLFGKHTESPNSTAFEQIYSHGYQNKLTASTAQRNHADFFTVGKVLFSLFLCMKSRC